MGLKGGANGLSKYDDKYPESSLKSSFALLKHYSGKRGAPFPNIFDWLEVKRRDDNIGNFWRVHDKLYDLEDFVNKHPGGSDWIDATRGTDITEAFEASHFVNVTLVEHTLAKYYVKEAKHPRNSPYTFKENGFYKTLKRKVVPVLNKVGTDSTSEILLIEDSLALIYGFFAILAVSYDILPLKIVAGFFLSLCVTGGHNFFHKKDNWRRFYFDLSPMSSYEWRLSHAISHHLYPNSILDYEIMLGEPLVEMLPVRERNVLQSYGGMIYGHVLYSLHMITDLFKRPISIYKGKQKLRPENLLIYVELVIFVIIAPSVQIAIQSWIIIFMAASYTFVLLSNNAAHHHPTSFHDGDETRTDPDFGLCQLDATKSKTDWYHKPLISVLTTFGEHPMHHLFPTVCHSKLKHLKPLVLETLQEFSEGFPEMTQWELFIGTHLQMARTKPNPVSVYRAKLKRQEGTTSRQR